MKITVISDTHGDTNYLSQLPKGDMIIHAGDFATLGGAPDIRAFLYEFNQLKFKHKIIVSGNHDWLCALNPLMFNNLLSETDIVYLQDEEVEIEGIKFYGTPWTKPFMDWAFMKPEKELEKIFSKIPNDVNVLISHGPPFGILDEVPGQGHEGSKALLEATKKVKPYFHIFGHIHCAYGRKRVGKVQYINCSLLDDYYSCVNKPVLIEI